VARARELRERISEKQTELLRVERHVDRERRLHSKPRVRTKKRAKSLAPRGPGAKERKALERQRHAVFRVLETAPFRDRTERVLVERIAAGLFSEDLVNRRQSTLELRRVASVAAVRLLMIAAKDPARRVRVSALNALVGSENRAVLEVFRRCLHDRDPQVRLTAMRGLACVGAELSVDELLTALDEGDAELRKTAASILGWRSGADVVRPLVGALGDEEESVRVAAAEGLAHLADPKAALGLIRALGDASPRVRDAAERALLVIVGPEIQQVAEGLSGAERISALKTWWRSARVEQGVRDRFDHALAKKGPERERIFAAHQATARDLSPVEALERDSGARAHFESLLADEAEEAEPVQAPVPKGAAVMPGKGAPAAPAPEVEDAQGDADEEDGGDDLFGLGGDDELREEQADDGEAFEDPLAASASEEPQAEESDEDPLGIAAEAEDEPEADPFGIGGDDEEPQADPLGIGGGDEELDPLGIGGESEGESEGEAEEDAFEGLGGDDDEEGGGDFEDIL
jgi:HEAT repeat protein